MTRQSCFVGNHPLELLKRPSVELRPLFSTATLATVADTAEIFQHNQAIGWKTIDEAAANGMEISSCPTAFLVAKPCPSFLCSCAFALQNAASGTEPLAPLYRLHTRNSNTVRSHYEVNLAEVNTDNILWGGIRFRDWNRNSDMQIEFAVSVAFENSKCGFRNSENWDVPFSDSNSALDPSAIARSNAHPDFIVFPEQSEKSCVQIQRVSFEIQRFQMLFFFDLMILYAFATRRIAQAV
jgi:hypothetical protein